MATAALRPITFGLDEGPQFTGLTVDGHHWNGWACPLVDEATMEAIAAFFVADQAGMDPEDCVFFRKVDGVWRYVDARDEGENPAFDTRVVDGTTYYQVGGSLCWNDFTDEK